MNIKIITVGPFEVNCCVIWGEAKQALVIDPGYDAPLVQSCLNARSLTVAAYLLTHGHADHICALAELHAARPAPVYIHAEDFKWAFGSQNQILPYYPVPGKPAAEFFHPESSEIPGFTVRTLETPGHTRGGVCYYLEEEKVIFTGDTLFKGSCGRADLPGGDGRILAQSLKKLASLPDNVTVHAGHNESTTIGYEKKTNFFMQQAAR